MLYIQWKPIVMVVVVDAGIVGFSLEVFVCSLDYRTDCCELKCTACSWKATKYDIILQVLSCYGITLLIAYIHIMYEGTFCTTIVAAHVCTHGVHSEHNSNQINPSTLSIIANVSSVIMQLDHSISLISHLTTNKSHMQLPSSPPCDQ